MTWQDQFTGTPTAPPASTPTTTGHRPDGLRRAILTAGIAGVLLVTGGVAVVAAASPDPSASTAPSTDQTGGTTGPSVDGRRGHDGQPCPEDQGGSGGSGGSSGSDDGGSADPSPSTATPAT
jgi:hypothetical protein